jgi:Cu2+-exporting ATPase
LAFTHASSFQAADWIGRRLFAIVIVFWYGGLSHSCGWPGPEIRNRKPGMMVLISLAISVAFIYSLVDAVGGSSASGLLLGDGRSSST